MREIGEKDWFVANEDDTYYCGDCLPPEIYPGDPDVEVWEFYSTGWLAPCMCKICKLSLPIYLDGELSEGQELPCFRRDIP